MAKNWIQGAVKRPGASTRAAHAAGESVGQWAEKHRHDSNPHVRGRALLALRFKNGDLSRRSKGYGGKPVA